MHSILLSTDFSNGSRFAIDYAINMFGTTHQYILFNAYEEPSAAATSMVSLRDILAEASEDSLKEAHAEILAKHPGIKIKTHSAYGDAANALTEYARNHKIDLILMGTKGASGITKFFMGSVAAAVIQKATCPVMLIPEKAPMTMPTRILFAADLSKDTQRAMPVIFGDILNRSGATTTFLTVDDEIDRDEAEKGYEYHIAMGDFPHEFDVVDSDDVEHAIRSYAKEHQMEMLVTIPRNASWLARLVKPSVSAELVENLEIPLLALH